MIKLIYANAETSMLSGEQIGAHSVRSVTGARNVRRLNFWRNKATEARRAVQPVRYRLAWPIDSGNLIGATGFPCFDA
jgi:hypothetical protein